MSIEYEISGKSKIEKDKGKCGDYFKYEVFRNEFVVLALSDGVGSRPCDWLASKTTCEKFIEIIGEKIATGFEISDLADICAEVDYFVSNPPENCKNMLAVFSAVVWNSKNDFLHFINVGDTRIYKVSKNEDVTQISTDELKAVNMRDRSGKLILSGGATVTRTGITNAFGVYSVKIQPKLCEFRSGDTIFLTSDGFYDCCPTFNEDIVKISHSLNLEESIEKTFNYYQDYQHDDASVLVIRNNKIDDKLHQIHSDFNFDEIKSEFARFQLIRIMYDKLKTAINLKNNILAQETISTIQKENLIPTKEMLDDLIQIMKSEKCNEAQVYNGIVKLIRIAMK